MAKTVVFMESGEGEEGAFPWLFLYLQDANGDWIEE